MLRLLLWILIIYIGWKVAKVLFSKLSTHPPKPKNPPLDSFDRIEDAEFEDITPKPPEKHESPGDK